MNHSLYLKLATVLIKADLHREERAWKRRVKASSFDIPWHNKHLLQDIGLGLDGRLVGRTEPQSVTVERRIRHLRRVLSARIPT